MVCPLGLMARYSTRMLCPVRVPTLVMPWVFQQIIWFSEYPWVEISSGLFVLNTRLHTWLPVSTHSCCYRVLVFQKRMVRSAVPPPEASRFWAFSS